VAARCNLEAFMQIRSAIKRNAGPVCLLAALVACDTHLDIGKDEVGTTKASSRFKNASPPGGQDDDAGQPGADVKGESTIIRTDCSAWDVRMQGGKLQCPAPADWARLLTPQSPTPDYGMAIAMDARGNAYVFSSIWGELALDNRKVGIKGAEAALLVSYAPDGGVRWAREVDGAAAATMALAGDRLCTVGIDHGRTQLTHLLDADLMGSDFLICYDLAGSVAWSRRIDGWDSAAYAGLAADSHGNFYLAGVFGGQLDAADSLVLWTDPSAGPPANEAFLASYDSNGAARFLQSLGVLSGPMGGAWVAVTSDDHVAVAGSFGNPFSLVRLDSDGRTQWAVAPADGYKLGGRLATGSDGSVVVVFYRGATGGPIETTYFKYDAQGKLVASQAPLVASAPARLGNGYVAGARCAASLNQVCVVGIDGELNPLWGASYAFPVTEVGPNATATSVLFSSSSQALLIGGYADGDLMQQFLIHVQPDQ
jgi:hypothetical protein